MSWTKEKILINIENLMRLKFNTAREAFDYYDDDKDGELTKKNFKQLLKEAQINKMIRGLVAEFMINEFDTSKTRTVNWNEFKKVAYNLVDKK